MNQGQRFNPINQVPFSGPYAQPYPLPFNYGAPQPHPLKQNFNHGVHQPFGVPQQFYNHPTYNDRSWIDKAVAYRAFMQNQQAPQPNNQQRVPQIQAHYTNYPILNQQAQQHYNQYQVQANYQRDQLTHAPYSRAPFGYTPISANQYYFNYPRGAIKSPQVFNAGVQSNQQSSTTNASRNFQPVSIYHNPVSYGHQIKPSFSPGYNQGFVAQRKPIPPYYAKPYAQPYAQDGIQSVDSLVRQGYTVENLNRVSDVDSFEKNTKIYNAKIEKLESLRRNFEEMRKDLDLQEAKTPSPDTLTSAQPDLKSNLEKLLKNPDYLEVMQMADYSRSQLSSGLDTQEKKPSTNPSSKEAQALQEKQYNMLCQQF